MAFTYKVDEKTNTVTVFKDDTKVPFLSQPKYPDGTPFKDAKSADSWAKLFVASLTDPSAPFPPSGPNAKALPKKVPSTPQNK